jgi:hypothetical protein
MTGDSVLTQLNVIDRQFSRLLDPASRHVLADAQAQVRASLAEHRARVRRPNPPRWGYEIGFASPLAFVPAEVRRARYQVDVITRAFWQAEDAPPIEQKLAVRVWGLDPSMIFREQWDSTQVGEKALGVGRRVMMRYHFDVASPGQDGPEFHLQAGGNAADEELCWLPEAISVPRIAHHPMDLVLVCELVAANFFGEAGRRTASDPTIRGAVARSQSEYVMPYLERCRAAVDRGASMLLSQWMD